MIGFVFSTGKKSTKDKQTQEQNPSPDGDTSSVQDIPVSTEGLLTPDPGLWEHINYILTNIQTLESITNQAERLAV